MKTYLECIPCFITQTHKTLERLIDDEDARQEILRQILKTAAELDFNQSPPMMGRIIHREIRRRLGDSDPYREEKAKSNRLATALYPGLKSKVQESTNPWETSLRLAIAGNIIDLAMDRKVTPQEIDNSIEEALIQPLPDGSIEKLKTEIKEANSILYIGDNAGEIVFDKLFIEQMPMDKICYVVRGRPILNDATMADAREVGLTDMVEVIDSGSDIPGIVPEECSPGFVHRLNEADLIISKGQGNYETLSDEGRNVCYLFKAKCPVVARDAGIETGKIAVLWKR